MIPVLAGILAAAALILMSMPFVLYGFASEPSTPLPPGADQAECEPGRLTGTESPATRTRVGEAGEPAEPVPARPSPGCEPGRAGIPGLLQPIHAIESIHAIE